MSKKEFETINNNKSCSHKMKVPFDYVVGKENFFSVKCVDKSYDSQLYYPSGRRTNKYQYPIIRHTFKENYSLAKCMPLNSIKLKEVK